MTLKVLVVDDSVVFRSVVRDLLNAQPDVSVVGVAANGRIALRQVELLRPDLLTLDFEMPELDGLGVLKALKELGPHAPGAIMLSAFTRQGARVTIEALHLGAFDFVPKPQTSSPTESRHQLQRTLVPKVEAFALARGLRRGKERAGTTGSAAAAGKSPSRAAGPASKVPVFKLQPQVVGIGVSTGGPEALLHVIPRLPADFPLPVLLVQHMPPVFTRSLAEDLDRRSRLRVCEAEDGQRVQRGWVYIAPGGKQMKVVQQGGQPTIRITDDPPVKSCRPSVDYLFESLAETYQGRVLAVVMTGMGDDGADGCQRLKAAGGTVIAQDRATCVVWGMPRAVVERELADFEVPLDDIPAAILRCIRQKVLA